MDHGAPLGFTEAIPSTGIFPTVEGPAWGEEQFRALERSLEGWSNYKSAEEEREDLQTLIQDYQARGFCHLVTTMEQAEEELGRRPVLNRLGVVVKWKGDKKKSRIIWDLRESRANEACSQGERIILPRLNDLGTAASRVYRNGGTPWIAGIDIKDAFMNIPAGRDKFMTVSVVPGPEEGSQGLVIFDTLVFGSTSSPTLWGRFAAWLGRSLACIEPGATIQTYVDDPGLILSGTLEEAAHQLTRLLLWVRVAGYPIKLEKAAGGKTMEWVGGKLTLRDDCGEVEVSIPAEKVAKLQKTTDEILGKSVVGARALRSYAGGLSFVAGMVPHLRPFLSSVWAALGTAGRANDGAPGHAGKLIHVRRIKPALCWVRALLHGEPAPLSRTIYADSRVSDAEIVTDACPFGMGAILRRRGEAREYFSIDIPQQALIKFRARRGDSRWTTLWEGLTLLLAFRTWLPELGFNCSFRTRSDSLSSLIMLSKGKARSVELNVLAREFALDQALRVYRLWGLEHIPGVTNVQADALSRQFAPQPEPFPEALHNAVRRHVAVDEAFWKVQPACAPSEKGKSVH